MKEIEFLGRLFPSMPEVRDILDQISNKYDIPEIMSEDQQISQILLTDENYDWEAIRQEIENKLREWLDLPFDHRHTF